MSQVRESEGLESFAPRPCTLAPRPRGACCRVHHRLWIGPPLSGGLGRTELKWRQVRHQDDMPLVQDDGSKDVQRDDNAPQRWRVRLGCEHSALRMLSFSCSAKPRWHQVHVHHVDEHVPASRLHLHALCCAFSEARLSYADRYNISDTWLAFAIAACDQNRLADLGSPEHV